MAPNVLLVDALYIDRLAATFRTHYEQELGRDIPKADLAQWLVCAALDAEFEGDVQVIFIHDREEKVMPHFEPGNFSQQIDGKAFAEPGLGEFTMACCPVERVTTLNDLCVESVEAVLDDKEVKRMAVAYDFDCLTPESQGLTKRLTSMCSKHLAAEAPKDLTLFVMQPLDSDTIPQQILGYSILASLGIMPDDLEA